MRRISAREPCTPPVRTASISHSRTRPPCCVQPREPALRAARPINGCNDFRALAFYRRVRQALPERAHVLLDRVESGVEVRDLAVQAVRMRARVPRANGHRRREHGERRELVCRDLRPEPGEDGADKALAVVGLVEHAAAARVLASSDHRECLRIAEYERRDHAVQERPAGALLPCVAEQVQRALGARPRDLERARGRIVRPLQPALAAVLPLGYRLCRCAPVAARLSLRV
jgi:hypothetical protein